MRGWNNIKKFIEDVRVELMAFIENWIHIKQEDMEALRSKKAHWLLPQC